MSTTYFCIPDIHGRNDLLQEALEFIYGQKPEGGKIVFLGDYIDRGPDNDKVLHTVMNPPANWKFVCLLGNHEYILVGACNRQNGFYDMNAVDQLVNSSIVEYRDVLEWMKKLKLYHIEDSNVFAHANYNDSVSSIDQNAAECVWPRFSDSERYDNQNQNLFLIHGHTPRKNGPIMAPNRLNLDTGAVFYNRLVIAEFRSGEKGPIAFHEFDYNERD